jgi:predicted alpha/beta-fold hydrolase
MPVKYNTEYKSPLYLFNKDLQTIIPALFRKVEGIQYKRERIYTPDQDFLDLDWSLVNQEKELVIISHGLEGDSKRPYVLGMVRALNQANKNVMAWNYRGCSGEINQVYKFYHSGETGDLDFVINHCINKGYSQINLIGFSVGGNITLKFLGETGEKYPSIQKAVVFSVPCHLQSSSKQLARFRSKIYMKRFIRSLSTKIREKALTMPDKYDCSPLDRIKNFTEFDTIYTAPMHGYKDAIEYWTLNSSLYFIQHIKKTTLIIMAQNDPFLSSECYPYQEAENNPQVTLEVTKTGGHCGFYLANQDGIYWSERKVLEFFYK